MYIHFGIKYVYVIDFECVCILKCASNFYRERSLNYKTRIISPRGTSLNIQYNSPWLSETLYKSLMADGAKSFSQLCTGLAVSSHLVSTYRMCSVGDLRSNESLLHPGIKFTRLLIYFLLAYQFFF